MPKLEQARHWAKCALVRTADGLLRLLPIDVGASLAASLVSWAAPWTAFHRRALRNLATAFPDWSEAERERVAAAMWRNTGQTIAVTLQLDRIFSNCSRIEMTGHGALKGTSTWRASLAVGRDRRQKAAAQRLTHRPRLRPGGQCLRIDRRSHFLVEIKELPVERTSDRTADLRDTTAAIARQFECWIRDAPAQWM
jgi:lauroyl/myristoyl acyltransferase